MNSAGKIPYKRQAASSSGGPKKKTKNIDKELEELKKILYTSKDDHYQNIKLECEPPIFADWETELTKSYEIIDWNQEANAIIKDVSPFVNKIYLSKILSNDLEQASKLSIYINLETKEGYRYTICLNASGLRICSKQFDHDEHQSPENHDGDSSQTDDELKTQSDLEIYETIYALLTNKSPAYRNEFASALINKMNNIR